MTTRPTFTRCVDAAALACAGADAIVAAAARAQAAHGDFRLALSGGSTPIPTYASLCQRDVDWSRVSVFFSDERCVAPGDPASNYGRAAEALLRHVPLPAERVHRMPGELLPSEAAARYEELLRQAFGAADDRTFDLCLLGLGADGHCASLFPGSAALQVHDRWVAATEAPAGVQPRHRLTLTFAGIQRSTDVLFLVAGADKVPVVQALQRDPQAAPYPAAAVRARARVRYLLTDEAWAGPARHNR
ncbi:MAG: 6-phosphogluconolactonase [Planctomycetota bacterium]